MEDINFLLYNLVTSKNAADIRKNQLSVVIPCCLAKTGIKEFTDAVAIAKNIIVYAAGKADLLYRQNLLSGDINNFYLYFIGKAKSNTRQFTTSAHKTT